MKVNGTIGLICVLAGLMAGAVEVEAPKGGVETEVCVPTAPYLVIDLQPRAATPAAKGAPAFSVSNLEAVPPGGWTEEYKTTRLVLRRVPSGKFKMGSPADEPGRDDDEAEHTVTLSKDFYIGVFEVTMRQWELVMGKGPGDAQLVKRAKDLSSISDAAAISELRQRPVVYVSFLQISDGEESFLGRLRAKTMLAGFDLPSEAQWEYACRAGTRSMLGSGKNLAATELAESPSLASAGRYLYNNDPSERMFSRYMPWGAAIVGSYVPNAWGLYDMHGNVWEWCRDWYGPVAMEAATDPQGAAAGLTRVVRGGGYEDRAKCCRSANRGTGGEPSRTCLDFGFRLVLAVP
jgi:formylglycine-generating enzyme required for sulfatase activity